jgi:hypothetical protein
VAQAALSDAGRNFHPGYSAIQRTGVSVMKSGSLRSVLWLLVLTAFSGAHAGSAVAQTPDEAARQVLKNMANYVSKLDAFSFDYSVELEAVTTKGIKLQFPASGQMLVERPNKFRLMRTGGHSDIELVSDGKTVTLYGRKMNIYAQNKAAPSIDEFVDRAREEHGLDLPGADLLLSNVYDQLIEPVTEAMYLGTGVVDGVECEHLAFRTPDVDWQIWVAMGDKPYPCKYVVTSKWTTAAPEYQLRVRNWNDSPKIEANSFQFGLPADAKEVKISEINTDILMPETLKGAQR